MELINEPLSPGVSLGTLTKYYRAGIEAVRKHSPTAYVVLSNRLGPHEPRELFELASGFTKIALDVHHYNLFSTIFDNLSVQQNIDYVKINRTEQLAEITTANGPLVFVGKSLISLTYKLHKTPVYFFLLIIILKSCIFLNCKKHPLRMSLPYMGKIRACLFYTNENFVRWVFYAIYSN